MEYTLMHRAVPVADIEFDALNSVISNVKKVHDYKHLPLGVVINNKVNSNNLSMWWRDRGIPFNRPGLHDALTLLRVYDAKELLAKGYGLSLSDQYWIRPANKSLRWEEINYFDNQFSADVGDALFGKSNKKSAANFMSPDSASDGWLRKRWIIHEGKRKLAKAGSRPNHQEPFNEVIASSICKRLKIPHVDYDIIFNNEQPLSICDNFIDGNTELVTAWYIKQISRKNNHESEFQHYIKCANELNIENTKDYLNKMLALDYIIANTDRHLNNFGAVRNAETLEWTGPAPIYDNGTSLWHDANPDYIKPRYKIESKPFRNNHETQIKLVSDLSWYDQGALNDIDEEFESILMKNNYIDKKRRDVLCSSLKTRIFMLNEIAQGIRPQRAKKTPRTGYDLER